MVPRCHVFDPDHVGIYHCFTQCVRQMFLLGDDEKTRTRNEHRRQRAIADLQRLAGVMGVEVCDFALMSNHLHVLLRNRPDLVALWSDREVARRWWELCPGRKKRKGRSAEPTEAELMVWVNEPGRIDELRFRLGHISWFMWFWLGKIAREANREDGKRGHFFADRFQCQRIEDEGALLACSMYTVLNPVRAGMVERAEDYAYSSLALRVAGQMQRNQRELGRELVPAQTDADGWLACLFLEERAAAYPPQATAQAAAVASTATAEATPSQGLALWHPFPAARLSDKGYLPMTWSNYLRLLHWTADNVKNPKGSGRMPQDLQQVLTGLGVADELWLDTVARFEQLFHYVVGTYEQLTAAATRLQQRWLQGVRACGQRFGQQPEDEAPPAPASG